MNNIQILQTLKDIANIYSEDIEPSEFSLNKRLEAEKQNPKTRLLEIHKRTKLSDLSVSDKMTLHYDMLTDWAHFQTRCIIPLKRFVTVHDSLASVKITAIDEVIENLQTGKSLKHRVSRSVLKNIKSKRFKNDPLLWNWNIHHFHLGDFNEDLGYSEGTNELLFAHIDENSATLLGLGSHQDFSSKWLLSRLLELRPDLRSKFQLNNALPARRDLSDEERKSIWTNVTLSEQFCGRVIMPPGLGVVSNGYALRLTKLIDDVFLSLIKGDKFNKIGLRDFSLIKLSFDSRQIVLSRNAQAIFRSRLLC